MSQFGFWTFQQLADELEVTVQYLYRIQDGKHPPLSLSATKVGGRWIVSEEEAKKFIQIYRSPNKFVGQDFYSPKQIAEAIGMTRKYVQDALTGYGGRKEPKLAGEKRGDRWVIAKEEAERFIREHVREGG